MRMAPRLFFACLVMMVAGAGAAAPASLDELLGNIVKEHAEAKKRNTEREQRFAVARDQQSTLLAEAKARLAAEQARADQLKATFSSNELALTNQLQSTDDSSGELRDFDAIVRQLATDLKSMLDASLVSAQKPERLSAIESLVERDDRPTMEDIEGLWRIVLEEIIESGKVAKFQTNVISAQGKDESRTVTRMGVFSATSDGQFLRYAPEVHQLVEQARQPAGVYRRMARNLEGATEGLTTVAFDPTRGSMLAILSHEPTLWERIKQGRLVGFLIMGLGAIALSIGVWKLFSLIAMNRAVNRQRASREVSTDNPLGRIIKVYTDNRGVDADTLELKLDEAILRELPPIQRGLGALVVIAEAAPLLGLLGTVSGMVATFQALSLFGAGDAKVVAGGISEALVATIIGLCVAIPSLVVHSFLKGKSDELVQVLDEQAAGMIAQMAEAHLAQRSGAAHPTAPHLAKV